VIDFGQACPIGTRKPRIQGTPDYIAPEQVRCEQVTAATDVYNFGLRSRFAPGQDSWAAIHDYGPVVNARGQALLLTAAYGAYRDDSAPCPAPWEGIVRWASQHSTRVWTMKAPPAVAAPTHRGFVIPATYCLRRRDLSHKDTADWYVDSRGRIGELRVSHGDPPVGTRADAPTEGLQAPLSTGTGRARGALLADRDSDRIWVMDPVEGLPDTTPKVPAVIIAQDVTGRRWTLYGGALNQGINANYIAWSDDQGTTWATAHAFGVPVYTDTTLAFLGTRTVVVSTDRGVSWHKHPIPDLRAVAVPEELPRRWAVETFPTASGALLAVVYYSPSFVRYRPRPPVLVRSTDKDWSHFVRVGTMPASYRWFVKDNTLSACDAVTCSYTRNLGASWRSTGLPD